MNDIYWLGTTKHSSQLLLKFLDSLGKNWEHHANFLKNNEKINIMDLNSMFGNLRKCDETKALHKDIMKDSNKENFYDLVLDKGDTCVAVTLMHPIRVKYLVKKTQMS